MGLKKKNLKTLGKAFQKYKKDTEIRKKYKMF
jgi:hypothetical protein